MFTGDALLASILYVSLCAQCEGSKRSALTDTATQCLLNARAIEEWLDTLAIQDAQGLGGMLAKLRSDHVQLAHKKVAIQKVQKAWVGDTMPMIPSASTEYAVRYSG